ncbi:MAG: hypothetical protein M1816_005725 [Peltula sp. TS41687]|nr:MAG: hypothetical protein M1816_005725 [Peltula sp. TS41687]
MPEVSMLADDLFDSSKLDLPPAANANDNPTNPESSSLKHLCSDIYARISAFLSSDPPPDTPAEQIALLERVKRQTQTSLTVIRDALNQYSTTSLSLSYNGGKDCLVVLILYLCALSTHDPDSAPKSSDNDRDTPPTLPPSLPAVYIVPHHPFTEIDAFVRQSSEAYRLDLARYPAPMRSAFEAYLRDRPSAKAVLVGTRRTDPGAQGLSHLDRTDGGWPDFMRVQPVIDWRYAEIWTFLRHLKIPYCPLYDRGYTSLGGTTDTYPNPALRIEGEGRGDGDGGEKKEERYRPAYELEDDLKERFGRS